jgi:hypothetical protein
VRRTRPGYATSPSTGVSLQVFIERMKQPKQVFNYKFALTLLGARMYS